MTYYLMPPSLWSQLTNVSGFTNLNGKTYLEYISKNIPLTEEQKTELENLRFDNLNEFWKKHNIPVTYDYND